MFATFLVNVAPIVEGYYVYAEPSIIINLSFPADAG